MQVGADRPTPLTPVEFEDLLRPLGPFGETPRLAVAVSGGGDSMALLRLAADWASRVDGTLHALTVDHGLRPEAAEEAKQVAAWCQAIGVPHAMLRWEGPKPSSAIQQRAREARYELMTAWCRAHAVPHLLLAHQQDDQAETFLYRMSRGSGIDGLAAMPGASVRNGVRLLRPLLTVPRARLEATLAAFGQAHIDDPSNSDSRYARIRLRRRLADLERGGLSRAAIAETAAMFGRLRAEADGQTATAAARCAAVYPEGYAEVDLPVFRTLSPEIARRVLSGLIEAVGGASYPPRRDRLERVLDRILMPVAAGNAATLGRCVLAPQAGMLRLYREPRHAESPIPVNGMERLRWDGRFDLVFDRAALASAPPVGVARLGERGWQSIADAQRTTGGDASRGDRNGVHANGGDANGGAERIPGPVRFALPALWQGDRVREVPHLGYVAATAASGRPLVKNVVFQPKMAVFGPPFWVA